MKTVFVLTVGIVMLAILLNGAGCGKLNPAGGSDDGEDLTFASKNNYGQNNIVVDSPDYTKNDPVNPNPAPENDTDGQSPEVPQVDGRQTEIPEIPGETDHPGVSTAAISETTAPPDNQPAKDGTIRLKFLAAGDNIMHSNMIDDAGERTKDNEAFNFKDMYRDIADTIKSFDIALVNVETPIAGDEFPYTGYPNFNTPKENGFALMDIGFEIINIANNHTLDKWEKGYMNSIEFWDKQNVLQIGGFKDQEDFETVRIYNKNGVSIAFLSYTYSTNGMFLPKESKMVIPYIDAETIERQIKAARPLADLLFVVMHWGDEDKYEPNQQQRNLAQMMVDNGVDVVIGMHPHVLQETKWVNRPDGKKTLLTYSIGNMISGMLGAQNMIGGFLTFDIVKTTKNNISDTTIENAKIIPVITHYNMKRKGFQIYRFDEYTEELAKAHGNINYDTKFSYKYIKDLIVKNIAPEFLSDFYK